MGELEGKICNYIEFYNMIVEHSFLMEIYNRYESPIVEKRLIEIEEIIYNDRISSIATENIMNLFNL